VGPRPGALAGLAHLLIEGLSQALVSGAVDQLELEQDPVERRAWILTQELHRALQPGVVDEAQG
jgi:hypothetical protein